MTPKLLLSLWRERWGKATDAPRRLPYIDGKVTVWGRELAASPVWGVPLIGWLVGGLCVLLGIFVSTISLTPNSQYAFSVFILCLALLLRRYSGTFVTLVLLGLAWFATSRYLFWRLTGTLVDDFSWDYILGFVLWAAELHFCVLVGLKLLTQIWPIRRGVATLPADSAIWPTVDIFVSCHGQSHEGVVSATNAALALVWPQEKVKIFLLDDSDRTDLVQLAESLHVNFLGRVPEDATTDHLNHAVRHTKGQLIVVLDADQFPAPDFLKQVLGEFLQDSHLGMLHTARHSLTPPLSGLSRTCLESANLLGSCAVLRRSAITEVEGVLSGVVRPGGHTALNLDALGYRHACLGFADASVFLIDTPFLGRSLAWRRRCTDLRDALQFYYPVARLIFYTAPAVYLMGAAHLVPISGEEFLAYALPHLLLGLMARDRLHSPTQIAAWAYVRETLLSWYIFLYTTLTLTKTELANREYSVGEGNANRARPFSWRASLFVMLAAAYFLIPLAAGGLRLWEGDERGKDALAFYLLWNAHHFFTLLAAFAVSEEVRHIGLHEKLIRQVLAVVKLVSGRSIRGNTESFPQTRFALQIPRETVVDGEDVECISLFLAGREFVFRVSAECSVPGVIHVHLRDESENELAELLKISRLRGKNWPQYLPGENADHPFPPWLTEPIVKMYSRGRDFLADMVINWSKKK